MPSSFNGDCPRKGQFFRIISSVFAQIMIEFGLGVDGHLFYHSHQLKLNSNFIESVFSIKIHESLIDPPSGRTPFSILYSYF